jgi:hypothetical protein
VATVIGCHTVDVFEILNVTIYGTKYPIRLPVTEILRHNMTSEECFRGLKGNGLVAMHTAFFNA